MRSRWRSEVWVLVSLLGVAAALGLDAGIRYFKAQETANATPAQAPVEPEEAAAAPVSDPRPEIADNALPIGSTAPDFELAAADGTLHRLSDFRGRQTVLAFYCGCARCQMMVRALQVLEQEVPGEGPQFVAVITIDPAAVRRWVEDTEYLHLLLLEKRGGPVAQKYDGDPCPRVYVLDPELRVQHVTPPPGVDVPPGEIISPIARLIGSKWRPREVIDRTRPIPAPAEAEGDAARKAAPAAL